MSDFSVKFIGGEYALPSELKEYLKICDKFSQISQFLSNALLETMQISSIIDGKPCQVGAIENELKEKMHNEGKKIISMLSEYGVYDITDSDIFENNKGYLKYVDAYKNMMKGLRNCHWTKNWKINKYRSVAHRANTIRRKQRNRFA